MTRLRSYVAALPLLLAAPIAAACPLCIGTAARSPAQDLEELPHAVLAVPVGQHYRVVDVVKGDEPAQLNEVVVRDPAPAGKPLLLVRDESWPMWVSLGPIGAGHAPTLRALAAEHPPETDTAAWRRRLDLAIPHLGSPEPLLAEIAWAECASAPYAALRAAKPRLEASKLRERAGDPAPATKQSLRVLLLGIAGDERDAAAIEAQLAAASEARDATILSSLLAADLELRGVSRVASIEDRYLRRDASRSTAEIQAALLALSVQAKSRGPIPRERVIEAYRVFIREHEDMAGFVASDLAAWEYWDATPEFARILESNVRQHDDSRAAIDAYLRKSPVRGSQ
jgi:hypothetical protein